MIVLNLDCVRLISNHLSLYHKIILSRVCKAFASALEETLKKHPVLQSQSLFERIFDKPIRIKLLKRVNQALNPRGNSNPPNVFPGAIRADLTSNYRLIVYPKYADLFHKTLFGWNHHKRIISEKLNYFLCGEKYLVHYSDYCVYAEPFSSAPVIHSEYDNQYPVLKTRNFFCFVKRDHSVLVSGELTQLSYKGFTFMHETETHLHLIAKEAILHIDLKTKKQTWETIDVPKVLRAEEDLLICQNAIIQFVATQSYTIYKI